MYLVSYVIAVTAYCVSQLTIAWSHLDARQCILEERKKGWCAELDGYIMNYSCTHT